MKLYTIQSQRYWKTLYIKSQKYEQQICEEFLFVRIFLALLHLPLPCLAHVRLVTLLSHSPSHHIDSIQLVVRAQYLPHYATLIYWYWYEFWYQFNWFQTRIFYMNIAKWIMVWWCFFYMGDSTQPQQISAGAGENRDFLIAVNFYPVKKNCSNLCISFGFVSTQIFNLGANNFFFKIQKRFRKIGVNLAL